MIRPFLISRWRLFKLQPALHLGILAGLAIAYYAVGILFAVAHHAASGDRWKNSSRVYRVNTEWRTGETLVQEEPVNVGGLPALLRQSVPGIEHIARICLLFRPDNVCVGTTSHAMELAMVDNSFFDIFPYRFIHRQHPTEALKDHYCIVLTEPASRRLFGKTNPVGKTVDLGYDSTYTVTGVVEPLQIPTHLRRFDAFYGWSGEWDNDNLAIEFQNVYVQLATNVRERAVQTRLDSLATQTQSARIRPAGNSLRLRLQPIHSILRNEALPHKFSAEQHRSVTTSQTIIASSCLLFLLLLVANFNVLTLYQSNSSHRRHEIGMRKLLGSGNGRILSSLLLEYKLLEILALGFACYFLAQSGSDVLNSLGYADAATHLRTHYSTVFPALLLLWFAALPFALFGVFSLANVQPVHIVRPTASGKTSGHFFRYSLLLLQFAVTVFLLILAFPAWDQVQYTKEADLGFDTEHVLQIPLNSEIDAKITVETLRKNPSVVSVAYGQNLLPLRDWAALPLVRPASTDTILASSMRIAPELPEVLGFRWIQRPLEALKCNSGILLNQTAAKKLGIIETDLPTISMQNGDTFVDYPVLGIFDDLRWTSLQQHVQPMVLIPSDEFVHAIFVRYQPTQLETALLAIQETFTDRQTYVAPQIRFLDDDLRDQYADVHHLLRVLAVTSLLAIITAMLGAWGTIRQQIQNKKRSIRIRKILGASELQLALVLLRGPGLFVGIGIIFAFIPATLLKNKILPQFVEAPAVKLACPVAVVITLVLFLFSILHQLRSAILKPPAPELQK